MYWKKAHNLVTRIHLPISRLALCIIYVWFGVLKLAGLSPAGPLVEHLFNTTLALLMPFDWFYIAFSIFEIIIGIMFIVPRLERVAFVVFILHLVMTSMPLLLLPGGIWQYPFVPTLEGQYII